MNTKFVPKFSRPCSEDWNNMTGDEKRRFCDRCQLHVHNLSAMTEAEQAAVLSDRAAKHCIAYVVREDAIEVRTETWLLLQRLLRPWRACVRMLAIVLPAVFASCSTPMPPQQRGVPTPGVPQRAEVRHVTEGKSTVTAGAPVYDPPLWRRIIFFWQR